MSHQIVVAQGGEEKMKAQMDRLFKTLDQLAEGAFPPEARGYEAPFQGALRRELSALIPKMTQVQEQVYADQLSEGELTDLLTWETSASGRSISSKSPGITAETQRLISPLILSGMPQLMHNTVRTMCVEQKCSEGHCQTKCTLM